ncbi:hypothetical protein T08_7576 [Trichinella sp. T8]|nr:hypothetical protein T08_7576 [Trichinella sp. T8]
MLLILFIIAAMTYPKEQCKRSVMCFATRCYRRIAQCTASTSVAEFFSCAMNLRWQPTIAGSPSVETRIAYAADTDRANEIFPAENEDEDTEATV